MKASFVLAFLGASVTFAAPTQTEKGASAWAPLKRDVPASGLEERNFAPPQYGAPQPPQYGAPQPPHFNPEPPKWKPEPIPKPEPPHYAPPQPKPEPPKYTPTKPEPPHYQPSKPEPYGPEHSVDHKPWKRHIEPEAEIEERNITPPQYGAPQPPHFNPEPPKWKPEPIPKPEPPHYAPQPPTYSPPKPYPSGAWHPWERDVPAMDAPEHFEVLTA